MVVRERRRPFIHLKDHIAALTAVSAVRTAVRDKFLPVEGYVTVPSFSALYEDPCSVYKIRHIVTFEKKGFKHSV